MTARDFCKMSRSLCELGLVVARNAIQATESSFAADHLDSFRNDFPAKGTDVAFVKFKQILILGFIHRNSLQTREDSIGFPRV